MIGGYYAYFVAVPIYPATTTVALQNEQQQVITDIESIFARGGTDVTSINTEFEVIRSRRLIGLLVDELNLVSDPEFNGSLRPESTTRRILNFLLGRVAHPPSSPELIRRSVIDAVIGRISVANIRQSRALTISITTTAPLKSAEIINTLAQLYVENQIQQKLEATEQAIEFLSRRTAELEANVELLEQTFAQRTERSNAITSDVLQARNLQLRDLRERVSELTGRITSEESLIASFNGNLSIDALESRVEEHDDVRFSTMLQRFRSGRITQQELEFEIADTVASLQQSLSRARQQLATLQLSEAQLASQVRDQSNALIAMQQLEREVDAARLLYQTFFSRLQEASVQQGLETADARILSEAVPRQASSPRKSRILVLSSLLGAMLGAGIVLLQEWRFAGFRTSDDLEQQTGQRILGSISSLANEDRRFVLDHIKNKQNSQFAEAVRNLRTSILMSNIDNEPQVILLTSAVPGEGKTTLAIALTRHLSKMEGKRALLLEADIRRNTLRSYIDSKPPVELMDILLGKTSSENIDLYNEDLEIELLTGTNSSGNAADLFASRRFKDLMAALRETFDYIVIDSPPVLAVPDARVLASYSDAVVFVVRWSVTSKTQVQQGINMIESVGTTLTGMVMTQVDQRKMKTYGYQGQYGYDGYAADYYGDT